MKKMLCKRLSVILLLLITFFSVSLKSNAASFAYKDFDWDEFAEKNKSYWISACDGDKTGKCVDRILETKKRFYTRLYEILTIVQNNTGLIDDNIIIATVFYGLTDESFADPNTNDYNPYNLDDDDSSISKNKYIGGDDGDTGGAKSYFEKESDSLKTLVNNFIGYRTVCYGDNNEVPQEYTKKDGTTYVVCPNDTYEKIDNKCVVKIDEYKGSFFDSIGLSWIGTSSLERCKSTAEEKGFYTSYTKTSSTKEISEDFFWDYLENSDYFDKKDHLQEYYAGILGVLNKEHMKDLTTDEILEYKDEIIDIRKRFITGIKEILKYYENISEQYNKVERKKYWWPIGSDITTEEESIIFASEEPSKTDILNNYGFGTASEDNSIHSGIDIPGELGVTNVIASFDGVVSSITTDCLDNEDISCGSGFGNHIIIQHLDGNYTLYAHLAKDSITVTNGDSVKKGQVIGKVGSSGEASEPHLHFEVRVGGNDSNSSQDPLTFVSTTNPRANGSSTEMMEWIGNMEGTGPIDGNNYVVYADSGGVLTVGHGITLKYNGDALKSRGYDPSGLSKGSRIPIAVVDEIYEEHLNDGFNDIKALLGTKGITLNDEQIAALTSLKYNCGNINGFFEAYNSYGSTEKLCTSWWNNKALHDQKGNKLTGLMKRRKAECDLFVNGNYNMNVYG